MKDGMLKFDVPDEDILKMLHDCETFLIWYPTNNPDAVIFCVRDEGQDEPFIAALDVPYWNRHMTQGLLDKSRVVGKKEVR